MSHTLMNLPYAEDALAPFLSPKTLQFHYGKHHAGYVNKLNGFLEGHDNLKSLSLEDLIKECVAQSTDIQKKVYSNAAQVWNHNFYWNSLCPDAVDPSTLEVGKWLEKHYGSLDKFKEEFNAKAGGQFGSGWAWLVVNKNNEPQIVTTGNADTPLTDASLTPLLTCDVWEHAYYLDYQNARPDYLNQFWSKVNWKFADENLANA